MGTFTSGQMVVAVLCASIVLQASAHVMSHQNGVHHMSNVHSTTVAWAHITRANLAQLADMFARNKQKVLSTSSFSWKDCGEPSFPGHLKTLTLTPDPLDLPGNISVGFAGSLNVSLASPIVLDLQVQKKVVFWITVPCIEHFGSCNYQDVCPFLEQLDCPPFFQKYGIPCKCPIPAGSYSLPPSIFFVDDRFLPAFLTNGNYRVTANLSQNDQKIGCVYIEFQITR